MTFDLSHVSARSKIGLRYTNGSPSVITQLHLADAVWVDAPPLVAGWKLVQTVAGNVETRPRIQGGSGQIFHVEFLDQQDQPVPIPIGAEITARVEFTDSAGLRWSRLGLEQPRPVNVQSARRPTPSTTALAGARGTPRSRNPLGHGIAAKPGDWPLGSGRTGRRGKRSPRSSAGRSGPRRRRRSRGTSPRATGRVLLDGGTGDHRPAVGDTARQHPGRMRRYVVASDTFRRSAAWSTSIHGSWPVAGCAVGATSWGSASGSRSRSFYICRELATE